MVSPQPLTCRQFVKTLGRVLHRRTFLRVPAWALRLLAGEMAREVLLASQRGLPEKLKRTGYSFRHVELEPTLKALLALRI